MTISCNYHTSTLTPATGFLRSVWNGTPDSHLGPFGLAGVKARNRSLEGPAPTQAPPLRAAHRHHAGPAPSAPRTAPQAPPLFAAPRPPSRDPHYPPGGAAGQPHLISALPAAGALDVSAASVETAAGRGRRK